MFTESDWKAIYSNCAATCGDAFVASLTGRAGIKPSSKNRCDHLVAFMHAVRFVRRMRDLADVKLRKQYENKRLNQGHENAQRHQRDRREPGERRPDLQRYQHLLVRKQVAEETNAE